MTHMSSNIRKWPDNMTGLSLIYFMVPKKGSVHLT